MEFNYWPLRKQIKEQFGTYQNFAAALNVPTARVSLLLSGKSNWTQDLMFRAAELLGIVGEIEYYFFSK